MWSVLLDKESHDVGTLRGACAVCTVSRNVTILISLVERLAPVVKFLDDVLVAVVSGVVSCSEFTVINCSRLSVLRTPPIHHITSHHITLAGVMQLSSRASW
jgi:hypothetical protein